MSSPGSESGNIVKIQMVSINDKKILMRFWHIAWLGVCMSCLAYTEEKFQKKKKKSLNNECGLFPWRKLPQDTIHSFRAPVRRLYGRTLVSVILKFGHLVWHWGWNPYERSPLDVCVVPDVFSASGCTAGNSLSKWPQALPAQWRRWWSTERLPENYKDR